MYMAAKLSHFTGMGVIEMRVSSDSNLLSHASPAVRQRRLLYSASAEDNETITCLFDF